MQLLIGLDAGTTGVTAVLYDENLRPLARAYREFSQHFPQPGWVEHDAEEIRGALWAVLGEVLAGVDQPIAAVGLTNQRETVFAVERATGRALGRGIVWQDRRTHERCQGLRGDGFEETIRGKTGLVLDPYFSASKMEWMLRERSGLRDRMERGEVVFATVNSLILQTLCGGKRWWTDGTNASRTMLFDIDQGAWSPELCGMFGVDENSLPEVAASCFEFGVATLPGERRVAVRGMAGDQQAALFGQGCLQAGDSKTTYGTGCFLMLNTGAQRVDSKAGLLTTLALGPKGENVFALEGSVFTGGAVIQWLRDGLGILKHAEESEALARAVPDTGGVVLVPAFSGLGAPHWDAQARGALFGMTRGTGREHIVRAALESIALQCVDIVDVLRAETGLEIASMKVDGGAVRNDLLMQMQADLARVTVLRPRDVESTARGAAACAGIGAGLWEDANGIAGLREVAEKFEPRMGAEEVRGIRERWQQAVDRVKS